jgi:hypothetical protein
MLTPSHKVICAPPNIEEKTGKRKRGEIISNSSSNPCKIYTAGCFLTISIMLSLASCPVKLTPCGNAQNAADGPALVSAFIFSKNDLLSLANFLGILFIITRIT